MLTGQELIRIMPYAVPRVEVFLGPLNDVMAEFEIDANVPRMAAFLAQVAHESAELRYVKEVASGEAYELRAELGNTEPGDGVRFKGRGLIQITGRANYLAVGTALGLDLIDDPELLEEPLNAARSAGWFWQSRELNGLADKGDFLLITKRINGGTNGWKARARYFERAKEVLS